jgi:hypothetical protein
MVVREILFVKLLITTLAKKLRLLMVAPGFLQWKASIIIILGLMAPRGIDLIYLLRRKLVSGPRMLASGNPKTLERIRWIIGRPIPGREILTALRRISEIFIRGTSTGVKGLIFPTGMGWGNKKS